MKFAPLLFLAFAVSSAGATERATFDSAGKLTSLVDQGATLPLEAGLYARFEGDVRVPIQPHDQRSPITREGLAHRWSGTTLFPNSGEAAFTAKWTREGDRLVLHSTVTAATPLDVLGLDYVIDLPRAVFVGGRLGAGPEAALLTPEKPAGALLAARLTSLSLSTADHTWSLEITLDQPRPVSVWDVWDGTGRHYRVRIGLGSGVLAPGDAVSFAVTLAAAARPRPAPARLHVDEAAPAYPFDGFGGNYCFATESPVVDYTLENLRLAWARLELKAQLWDRQRDKPGPQLRRDFELMQRIQRKGVPWIISVWRVPERFYEEPNRVPMRTFGRRIAGDRWPELLDLLGSYLVYLKQHYGAEPDLFSFNEPDLGVSVGFSAEGHRDAIKRIGARFASLGLKTRMLLGDTANPRDSHTYVLPTAEDPEAMRYVGAVSFHSWGSGTPAQYGAWADVAHWLKLPLLVGEAGVDPGAYRNHTFDSYGYGLTEIRQYQELLRDATPQALIYWQFTEDYGLVHRLPDGKTEPTGRFWLMKQLVDLTPRASQVLKSGSDQPDVLVSAFRRGDAVTVHVLNLGAEREAVLEGLGGGDWTRTVTTEDAGFVQNAAAGPVGRLVLPARSLTSLVRGR